MERKIMIRSLPKVMRTVKEMDILSCPFPSGDAAERRYPVIYTADNPHKIYGTADIKSILQQLSLCGASYVFGCRHKIVDITLT